jgi:hypothetical protein
MDEDRAYHNNIQPSKLAYCLRDQSLNGVAVAHIRLDGGESWFFGRDALARNLMEFVEE